MRFESRILCFDRELVALPALNSRLCARARSPPGTQNAGAFCTQRSAPRVLRDGAAQASPNGGDETSSTGPLLLF